MIQGSEKHLNTSKSVKKDWVIIGFDCFPLFSSNNSNNNQKKQKEQGHLWPMHG